VADFVALEQRSVVTGGLARRDPKFLLSDPGNKSGLILVRFYGFKRVVGVWKRWEIAVNLKVQHFYVNLKNIKKLQRIKIEYFFANKIANNYLPQISFGKPVSKIRILNDSFW
jgi:hypothetical protein